MATGLVANQLEPESTYTAGTRTVDPNELSATQLSNMLSGGSPLMQRARAVGTAAANRRGLVNSSMAAGSAQNAMIESAQPFALSDAEAYRSAGDQTFTAGEQGKQFNAGNAMDLNRLNVAGQLDMDKLDKEYQLRNEQLGIQNDMATQQAGVEQANVLQRQYASQANALMDNYMNGWFRVQESEMTPAEKTAALGEYNTTVRTWQDVLNTAYASFPQWLDEWGISFNTTPAAPVA